MTPEETYDSTAEAYDRVRLEAEFTLEHFLAKHKIKVHSVTSRLKTRQSYLDKIARQESLEASESKQSFDLAGIRVVCLFLSDLERVGQVLRDEFDVISVDNKISQTAEDVFGYMSVHYIVRFKPSMAGPRYDELHGLDFEVQVRTILMDAWANVSHYLDYKGEGSIPSELRRDFYALSGLFYVADRQFETFSRESGRSAKRATTIVGQGERNIEVNLNTVEALVRLLFSDRRRAPRNHFASFADELNESGYESLADVEREIGKGLAAAIERDARARDGRGGYFTDIGMARIAISTVSPKYEEVLLEAAKTARLQADTSPKPPRKRSPRKASPPTTSQSQRNAPPASDTEASPSD